VNAWPPAGLRVFHLNVGGSLHATDGEGAHARAWLAGLRASQPSYQLFVFTETWTAAGEAPPSLDGFSCFSCRRAGGASRGRPHGGILAYVHNSLAGDAACTAVAAPERGTLTLTMHALGLAVVCCYFSPDDATGYHTGALCADPVAALHTSILQLQARGLSVVVIGDLNARVKNLAEYPAASPGAARAAAQAAAAPPAHWAAIPPRQSADRRSNRFGINLMQMLPLCDMVLLNGRAPGDAEGRITCTGARQAAAGSRHGGSVADLGIASVALYTRVQLFRVGDPLWLRPWAAQDRPSQHSPLHLHLTPPLPAPPTPMAFGDALRRAWCLRPAGAAAQQYVRNMLSGEVGFTLSVVGACESDPQHLHTLLETCIKESMPLSYPPPAGPPPSFWDGELAAARQRVRDAWHAVRATPLQARPQAEAQARAARREYTRLLGFKKRVFRKQQQHALVEAFYGAPALFWKAYCGGGGDAAVPAPLGALTAHFDAVYNAPLAASAPLPQGVTPGDLQACRTVLLPAPTPLPSGAVSALNAPITALEVEAALKRLRKGKSADSEGLTAECLLSAFIDREVDAGNGRKHTLREFILVPLLTRMFNELLQGAPVPWQFTHNTLTPIYKGKGSREALSNYRGIAVGNILGRVYESVLHNRLSGQIERLGLRAETQCGFRAGRGTLDALFTLQHLADRARVTGNPVYVVLVDFKMAFDVCDRRLLSEVWESLGISGPFLAALRALYDEIHMLVKQQGRLGSPFQTTRGTKQGSELSPLIFGLFIERLRPLIEHRCPGMGPLVGSLRVPEMLYADDLLFATEDAAHMQALLDTLAVFCHLFRMMVNLEKTFAIVLCPAGPGRAAAERSARRWRYAGKPVKVLPAQVYLGLTFHRDWGAGRSAAATLAQSGRRAMTALLGRARQMQIDQSKLLCHLFDSLVCSVISYGCQIWGPALCLDSLHADDPLDRKRNPGDAVHLDFLRSMAGLPHMSHKWTVLAEFGRQPLLVQWLALAGRFWHRVRLMPPGRLLREAVTASIELWLQHREERSWVGDFLACLEAIGVLSTEQMSACGTVQCVWALPITEAGIQGKAVAHFAKVWANSAGDPRTAPSEAVVAATYVRWVRGGVPSGPAPHFTALLGYKAKATLLRLRVSSYPLRIATGRNEGSGARNAGPDGRLGPRGIPRAERMCRCCTADIVEDLKHFLLECPAYTAVKQQFAPLFAQQHSTVASILGHNQQAKVAAAISAMLTHRQRLLSS